MEFEELIEKYFNNKVDKINIEIPEEDEIITILYDKFKETDIDFYNKCYDLISLASGENRYNSFIAGFKAGFEFAKSLNNFLEK